MRKIFIPLIIVFVLLLGACGSANSTQAASTAASTTAPTASDGTQPTPAPTAVPFTNADTPCKPLDTIAEFLPLDPNLPAVTAEDWVWGSADAPVTMIVYDQFDCPGCKYLETQIRLLKDAYPNDFRLVFRHFFFHDNADLPARAAEAAGRQGKFFEVAEHLFADVENWYGKTGADFETYLGGLAEKFDLDANTLIRDYNDQAIIDKVAADNARSKSLGLNATPSVFFNGSAYNGSGVPSFEQMVSLFNILKNIGSGDRQMSLDCPAMTIDSSKDYLATLTTTRGDIVIDLLEKVAPYAVNSFVNLAQSGWYNDNAFYVVRPEFALTGDRTNSGIGGPGYAFLDEIDTGYNFDKEGVVGMYNFGSGTNGSQFFIIKSAMDALNGKYSVFGQVIEGLDILKSLTLHETSDAISSADKILSVTISTR